MRTVAVVDKLGDWSLTGVDVEVISAKQYLSDPEYDGQDPFKVLNLCRSYAYQRLGYYVSLVAAARGHKPQPSLLCIEDLKSNTMIRTVSKEMDDLIQKSLKDVKEETFTLSIYFGQNVAKKYTRLASYLCKQFPAPFLQARFNKGKDKWMLVNIYPVALDKIPEKHLRFAEQQTVKYLQSDAELKHPPVKTYRYEMAILVNPEDPNPPSDRKAIQAFVRAGEAAGFGVEVIGPGDFGRVPEFDALFIRETTNVNHHTFRFARRAVAHGLVVIDDPHSILRCSNKIYLAELLSKHQLPTPATQIIEASAITAMAKEVKYPLVLKQPDGSFSKGVVLVNNEEEFIARAKEFSKTSDLIVGQEFMPSEFDWRIGVLGGKVLYACKYYMVRNHWQILRSRGRSKEPEFGDTLGVPLSKVPQPVINYAIKVSKLIGNGFYGIDIKEVNGKYYVIEINDNPSVDSGFEDELLGDRLYEDVMNWFLTRVEARGSGRRE